MLLVNKVKVGLKHSMFDWRKMCSCYWCWQVQKLKNNLKCYCFFINAVTSRCYVRSCYEKFREIKNRNSVSKSIFNKVLGLQVIEKIDSGKSVSYKFCKVFLNTFLLKEGQMTVRAFTFAPLKVLETKFIGFIVIKIS